MSSLWLLLIFESAILFSPSSRWCICFVTVFLVFRLSINVTRIQTCFELLVVILVIESFHGVSRFIISTDLGWFVGHTRTIVLMHRLFFKFWKTISKILGCLLIILIEIYILLVSILTRSILLWICLWFRHLWTHFLLCLIVIGILTRLLGYILHLSSLMKLLLSLWTSPLNQILSSFNCLGRSLILTRVFTHTTVGDPFALNWIIILVLFLRHLQRQIWI
jgi:hypothetical protein